MEEASPYAGTVGDIRDIESFETAAQWGAHTLGSLLPQAMLSLGTGGAGSFVGKRVLGTVVANGAKSAIAAAEQSLIKQGLSAELAREAAVQLLKQAAEERAAKEKRMDYTVSTKDKKGR